MVAIISGRHCSACGGNHEICVEDTQKVNGNFYVYQCPASQQEVFFTVEQGQWNIMDTACPKNHLIAIPAP